MRLVVLLSFILFTVSSEHISVKTQDSNIIFKKEYPEITINSIENNKISTNGIIIHPISVGEIDAYSEELLYLLSLKNTTFTIITEDIGDEQTIRFGISCKNSFIVTYQSVLLNSTSVYYVFKESQNITDVASGKQTEVKLGSIKLTIILGYFPFQNEVNYLKAIFNVSTSIPNSIYSCAMEFTESEQVKFGIVSQGIMLDVLLVSEALGMNFETGESKLLNVVNKIYICPTKEFSNVFSQYRSPYSYYCPVDLSFTKIFPDIEVGENYPLDYIIGDANPAIELLEFQVTIDNFHNLSLDFDPDFTVLLSGKNDNSSDYNIFLDIYIWLSLSAVVIAILFIILIVGLTSTRYGRFVVTGRKSISSVEREIDRKFNNTK